MKYYFCKFFPPRKDFVKTMTAEEAKLFKEHGAYLQGLLERNKVVAHGPVIDPAGGFGLSLFGLEDDEGAAHRPNATASVDRDAATIWTVYTSESPGTDPEFELTLVLLHAMHGPAVPEGAFWRLGLLAIWQAKAALRTTLRRRSAFRSSVMRGSRVRS